MTTSVVTVKKQVQEIKQHLDPRPSQNLLIMTWEGCIDVKGKRDCAKCVSCSNDVRIRFLVKQREWEKEKNGSQ